MARVSKDPQERRTEFMDIAERLFLKQGFHPVMVSDIVKAAGVAQGTFYYYFKTKDEILEALIARQVTGIIDTLRREIHEGKLTAFEALTRTCQAFLGDEARPHTFLFQPGNEALLDRFMRTFHGLILAFVAETIRRGVAEGSMRTACPDEVAEVFVMLGLKFVEACHRHVDPAAVARWVDVMLDVQQGLLKVDAAHSADSRARLCGLIK